MSIHGTCEKCGGETMDYCCPSCDARTIGELEEEVERLTIENGELKAKISTMEEAEERRLSEAEDNRFD